MPSVTTAAVVQAAAQTGQALDQASVAATLRVLLSHGTQRRRHCFVIGSRESELAMIQSRHVRGLLSARFPDREFVIRTSSSAGDDNQTASLDSLAKNNAGLFTKTLEVGLVSGAYDLAVHSLKDMPTSLPDGLALVAITAREDPEDALVVHPDHKGCGGLAGLPEGSVVGTSSLRRAALLRRQHPHLKPEVVRGNLQTRLAKLDAATWAGKTWPRQYDALILAAAGMKRLGWQSRIEAPLPAAEFPYGVGQGALGIECRANDDDLRAMLVEACEHPPTASRCRAERAFLRALQGGCQVPIAVTSSVRSGGSGGDMLLDLYGIVLSLDGAELVEGTVVGAEAGAAAAAGEALARDLIGQGAERILGDLTTRRPITYSVVATGTQ